MGVCVHSPFSQRSSVQGLRSSHPRGHVRSVSSGTGVGCTCCGRACTWNRCVRVICCPLYASVTCNEYCPEGASEGILTVSGTPARSLTVMLCVGTGIVLGPVTCASTSASCARPGFVICAVTTNCPPGCVCVV